MIASPRNILTIDVEEYFHALNLRPAYPEPSWDSLESRVWVGMERLFELLARKGVSATFFVLGWVAERHRDLVQAIAYQGHEVASHGISHRTAFELGPGAYGEEIVRSRHLLEELSGRPVVGFRASTFSVTLSTAWVFDHLLASGYAYDSSVFPVRHDRYGVPGFSRAPVRVRRAAGEIVELPLLTRRILGVDLPAGGGGYLRLLPMGFHRRALRDLNAQGEPAVVYLHPWELDPDQPRARLPVLNRWRHYGNLRRTVERLSRLLDEFPFGTALDFVQTRGRELRRVEL
ncbi:MAG: XrtA system polysaccharide deacetylase [Planctomycetota bacterium]